MEDIMVFLISFILVFIVYFILYCIKRRKKSLRNMQEIRLLVAKFRLKDVNYKKLGFIVILINSFIIALTGTVCTMIDTSMVWQLVIGFAMLMALIILCYGCLGFIIKRGMKKNGH